MQLFEGDSDDEYEGAAGANDAEDDDDDGDQFFSRVSAGGRGGADELDSVRIGTLSLGAGSGGDSDDSVRNGSGSHRGAVSSLDALYPTRDWTVASVYQSIRNRFTTGNWAAAQAADADADYDDDEDRAGHGGKSRARDSDEEEEDKRAHRKDRKNRRKNAAEAEKGAKKASGGGGDDDEEDEHMSDDDDDEEEREDRLNARFDAESSDILGQLQAGDISMSGGAMTRAGESEEQARERRAREKAALKSSFDAGYDIKKKSKREGDDDVTGENTAEPDFLGQWNERAAAQAGINKEFASEAGGAGVMDRLAFEGARSGSYVRVELLRVPCEFVDNFDPAYPLVLGGLLPGEDNLGYMQIRIKKHRWHKKVRQ
jgi:ribosome biogenesis protein BMS1